MTNAPVIAKVLTGFVSGAGTVSATDSILSAFQKLDGNNALRAPLASPTFSGTVTFPDASTITSSGLGSLVALGVGVVAPAAGIVQANTAFRGPAGSVGTPAFASSANPNTGLYFNGSNWALSAGGSQILDYNINLAGTLTVSAAGGLNLRAPNSPLGFQNQTFITSPASATIQHGGNDGAAPVAQIIKFQNGSGTNISGQNATIVGSLSTGTGTDGDIILQTGIKNGGSNATPATATTAVTVKGETQEVIFAALHRSKGYTVSGLPTGNQGDIAFVTDQLTTCAVAGAALTGGGAKVCPVFFDGSAWVGG